MTGPGESPPTLFLSYAHLDDEPLIEGRRGWVSSLQHTLEQRLAQLLGVRPRIWRDRSELRGNDRVQETLTRELGEVAALVCVVSPAYLESDWCLLELQAFLRSRAADPATSSSLVFKVVKTPVPLENQPPELRDLVGYDFYRFDCETARARDLTQDGPGEDLRAYLEKVDDLAQDLAARLRKLSGEPLRAPGEALGVEPATLYLAETTFDLELERTRLLRSLRQQGHRVLPERPLAPTEPELRARIQQDLERSRLSVHLLGAGYGPIPPGEARSLGELQYELAQQECSARADFQQLVWLPPSARAPEAEQSRLIERVERDPEQRRLEIQRQTLEDLKGLVADQLASSPAPEPPSSDEAKGPVELGNPYPGLRSFTRREAQLFFGREPQIQRLLSRLSEHRFLAIVGPSGSGKSSLARAGLLPRLSGRGEGGDATTTWRLAALTPGQDPIGRLARALAGPEALGWPVPEEDEGLARDVFLEATLRRGSLGLLEAVEETGLAPTRLLVLVDQLEEIFRYRNALGEDAREDDATAFVELLLTAVRRGDSVAVAVTLRSDFLGDCARFRGLAEAVDDGQYFVPRLSRGQLRQAITGPASLGGAEIRPRLLQRLLGEVGDDPDQLPILQHALMRTWEVWSEAGGDGPVDLPQYEATGGMRVALSRHADEAYAELDVADRRVATALFQRLTERGTDGREVRRPARLSELIAVTRAPEDQLRRVVEVFRRSGSSFLTPAAGVDLDRDSVIDISHESLMRVWARLRGWIDAEGESALRYQRLAESAVLYRQGQTGLMRDPELSVTLAWRDAERPGAAWAERYHPAFEEAMAFLENSRDRAEEEALAEQARRKRALRQARTTAVILAVAFLLAALLGLAARRQQLKAQQETERAEEQLARNDWSNGVAGRRLGDRVRAAHYFARYLAHEREEPSVATAHLNLQVGLRGVALVAAFKLDGPVRDIFLMSDEQRILALSEKGIAYLWHPGDGAIPRVQMHHEKRIFGATTTADERRILTWSEDSTARLWHAVDGSPAGEPMRHERSVTGARFSPDEARILTWGEDATARLWSAEDGSKLAILAHEPARSASTDIGPTRVARRLRGADFSSDGERILTWSNDGTARLWDADGVPVGVLQHGDTVWDAIFDADERRVLTHSKDGTARLWSIRDGSPIGSPMVHQDDINDARFSPDGRLIVTASEDATARLWHAANGTPAAPPMEHGNVEVDGAEFTADGSQVLTVAYYFAALWNTADGSLAAGPMEHQDSIETAIFTSNERGLLTTSEDRTARLWNTRTGAPYWGQLSHEGDYWYAKFSADDRRFLTWSDDGTARLWNTLDGSPSAPAMTHALSVEGAGFTSDDSRVVTWGDDGSVRVWWIAPPSAYSIVLHHDGDDRVRGGSFSSDGERILTWGSDGTARVWNAGDGSPAIPPLRHEESVAGALFSPDERRILTWSHDDTARLWDAEDGSLLVPPMQHTESRLGVTGALFPAGGQQILTWSHADGARLWSVADGAPTSLTFTHERGVTGAMFDADARRILTRASDGSVRVWSTAEGSLLAELQHGVDLVYGALLSHDERRVLTWSHDGTVRLWDTSDGSAVLPPLRHDEYVSGAAFTSDERWIVTWGGDDTARLWDAENGSQRTVMRHPASVNDAHLSADDRRLLTSCFDGKARLWDLPSGTLAAPPMRHATYIRGARFSSDERLILTWGNEGTAQLWHAEDGSPVGEPLRHAGTVWGASFSADDRRVLSWSSDSTARLWDLRTDEDFPRQHLPLAVAVTTGTVMDDNGVVSVLSPEDWHALKQDYVRIAEEHLESCRHPEANFYRPLREVLSGADL